MLLHLEVHRDQSAYMIRLKNFWQHNAASVEKTFYKLWYLLSFIYFY